MKISFCDAIFEKCTIKCIIKLHNQSIYFFKLVDFLKQDWWDTEDSRKFGKLLDQKTDLNWVPLSRLSSWFSKNSLRSKNERIFHAISSPDFSTAVFAIFATCAFYDFYFFPLKFVQFWNLPVYFEIYILAVSKIVRSSEWASISDMLYY